ncbi:MAG: HI0074 family nucleotidyltransferase substrate-binding subunit [Bacteroidota bacterium]
MTEVSPEIRYARRKENFLKAVARLERVVALSPFEDIELLLIKAFELSFESAWMCLKDRLQLDCALFQPSPKPTIQTAFKAGYISNGPIWMKMLESWNLSCFSYDDETAQLIAGKIRSIYLAELSKYAAAIS